MFYNFVINPIVLLYKWLYLSLFGLTGSYGISLLLMSVITFLVTSPFMRWAGSIQMNEKHIQDILKPQIEIIKSQSQGAQQHRRISTLYKSYAYHPAMAVRSVAGLAVQIPFLIAAYYMLSELPDIKGQSFLIINDLSKPDGLIGSINVLPILMTVINLMSACTTAAFARKDKLQAALIAFIFLLLLYTAPSALLIFWTCNNLWGLLGNLWKPFAASHGLADLKLTVKGRTILKWLSALSYGTYVITALTATFFIFVPIDIYLKNSNEFWFSLGDIIWMLLFCFAAATLILFAIGCLLKGKAKTFFLCLLLGLTLGLFIQSYIINIDYGVLDGRQIDWSNYRKQGIINTSLWLACIYLPFLLFKLLKKSYTFNKLLSRLACGLIMIQVCTVLFLFSTTPIENKSNIYFSTEKMFELSSKNNIIVFILDTFESKEFKRIIDEHPELSEPLDGFTYYPDAVGSYPTTIGALPQILTGEWYEHKESYQEYLDKGWDKNKFWNYLNDVNYDCRVFPAVHCAAETAQINNLVSGKIKISSHLGLSVKYFKFTAFRSAPHFFKRFFILYTRDFDKYRLNEVYRTDDVNFHEQLNSEDFHTQDQINCFRFYHLQGPHGPWTMTRDIKRDNSGSLKHDDQAIGSLKIVYSYISKLKEQNLYDKSAIIIMADHGNHSGEAVVRSPLVLIKEQNSLGKLGTSTNPVSFDNLFATIAAFIDKESAAQFGIPFMEPINNTKPRRFLSYIWNVAPPKEDVVPFLEEFNVIGNAGYTGSWNKTGKTYGQEQKQIDNTYKLGEIISFAKNGNSSNFIPNNLFSGWSNTENNYTWTEGNEAVLSLKNIYTKNNNIKIKLNAFPYLGAKLKQQKVDLFVDGIQVAKWNVTKDDWYEATIPKNTKNDGKLKIKIKISDPISPKEVGQSRDSRKLGIAVKQLVITEI